MNVAQKMAHLLAAIANCRKFNNQEWMARHEESLQDLERRLPSGSGFDSGSSLNREKSTPEKLVFDTAFHHMNDVGYYIGWTSHTVTVTASMFCGLQVKITGRNRNNVKEAVHEAFYSTLMEELQ